MSEYLGEFARDAEVQITELNNGLLELERAPEEGDAIERVFRAAHTLKGNCAAVGLADASALAHAIEELLDAVRAGELDVTGELMDDAFDAVDELEAIVEAADADERAPDPAPTIDRLRERLEEEASIAPPTDADVDRLLGRFEPADGDVDTYVVRLAVERESDGPRVVDALIDAFDYLGSEPPREELEAGEYGGTFDAAFHSAVDEEAIAAALEPVDAVSAFEIVTATDRPVGGDPSSSSEDGSGPSAGDDPSSSVGAPEESRVDVEELSVDELLEEVSEFDDLDRLVEEVEVDEAFEEMGEAGSFDELLGEEGVGTPDPILGDEPTDEPDRPVETEPGDDEGVGPGDEGTEPSDGDEDADDEGVDDASAVFAELKAEVETVEFDELTEELEALEFEEYEEEVGMDELLGDDDPDGGEPGVEESSDELSAEPGDGRVEAATPDSAADPDGPTDGRVEAATPDSATDPDGPTDDGAAAEPSADSIPADDSTAEASDDPATEATDDPAVEASDDHMERTDDDAGFDGTALEDPGFQEPPTGTSVDGEEFDDLGFDGPGFDGPEFDDGDAAFDEPVSDESAFDGPEFDDADVALGGPEFDDGDAAFDEPEPGESAFDADVEGSRSAFGEVDDRTAGGDVDEPEAVFGSAADAPTGRGDESADADGPGRDDGEVTTDEPDVPDVEIPDIEVPEADDRTDREEGEVQSIRVDVDQVDELLTLVEGLVTNRVRLRHAFETDAGPREIRRELDDLDDITAALQEAVMDARLVPLGTITGRLPRVVRDVAREGEKEVTFEVVGEDTELDRSILERIGDPLVHLVRNAVDHGIEPPDERETAGKPPEGSVTVRADRSGDRVTIEVTDDGRGLDADALRTTAVSEGVLEEGREIDDQEAFELIFHSGLSTAEKVTDVSGRGVGMDVVRRTVEELEGTVAVESESGEGTTVRMDLPVTVAIEDVLFVARGGEEFGIPTKAIQDVETETAVDRVDEDTVRIDGEELPLIDLADALDTAESGEDEGTYVRVREEVRPVALYCGEITGQREVVVKPFEGFLGDVPGIGGATVRGRGEVVTILDVRTI